MDISIIIPTYNRGERLHSILDAWRIVLNHTDCSFELVFSDDGSSDNTLSVLKKCKDLPIVLVENEHGGASSARNHAIKKAVGDRVVFVGDDIYPEPYFLQKHYDYGQQYGDKVAILGAVDWHPDQKRPYLLEHITEVGNEQFSFNRLKANSFIDFRHFYTCNVSVSRSMLNSVDIKFDERFYKVNFEDTELSFRLCENGMRIFYAPDVFASHYHEYEAERFCNRQAIAGEMAVVFEKLHPQLESMLGVKKTYEEFLHHKNNSSLGSNIVSGISADNVLQVCEGLEADLAVGNDKSYSSFLKKNLSLIYGRLFKMKYHEGILLTEFADDRSLVEAYLLGKYFDKSLCDALTAEYYFSSQYENGFSSFVCLFKKIVSRNSSAENRYFLTMRNILTPLCGAEIDSGIYKISILPFVMERLKNHLKKYYLLRKMKYQYDSFRRWLSSIQKPKREEVDSYSAVKIVFLLEDVLALEKYEEVSKSFQQNVIFMSPYEGGYKCIDEHRGVVDSVSLGESDYDYICKLSANLPPFKVSHIKNIIVALCVDSYDLVLISFSYVSLPTVGVVDPESQIVYSKELYSTDLGEKNFFGKVIKLMPSPDNVVNVDMGALLCGKGSLKLQNQFNEISCNSSSASVRKSYSLLKSLAYTPERDVIFLFPIFMAVGGAERNIIEVMRQLSNKYHFVIVTMERHTFEQGSLHHQLGEISSDVLDLGEVAKYEDYLSIISDLKRLYKPKVLLITNGSPWLLGNSKKIRKIFHDVPIVDHQVYDHENGWIRDYRDSGIQSFDYYVAINKKIEKVFVEKKGIAANKISQIYHAMNTKRIVELNSSPVSENDVRAEIGLDSEKNIYVYVSRMSDQKKPLDFLALVNLRKQAGDDSVFVMVGDGELSGQVDDYIQRYDLDNVVRIKFIDNPLQLMSVSKAIIFTSVFEGLPVAMLEALSIGVPVFSTDTGDIKYVLEKYNVGQVIPCTQNADDYNASFEEFLKNIDVYRESLLTAKNEIMERFSPEEISSQYDDLFVTAINHFAEENH